MVRNSLFCGKRKFDHIIPAPTQLKLLPVTDPLHIREATMMFKIRNNLAPQYLTELYQTRSKVTDIIPGTKTA